MPVAGQIKDNKPDDGHERRRRRLDPSRGPSTAAGSRQTTDPSEYCCGGAGPGQNFFCDVRRGRQTTGGTHLTYGVSRVLARHIVNDSSDLVPREPTEIWRDRLERGGRIFNALVKKGAASAQTLGAKD